MRPAFRTLVALSCIPSGLPRAVGPPALASTPSEELAREIRQATADGRKKWEAHEFGEALKSYRRAQQAAHRAADVDLESRAWLSICSCQTLLSRFADASRSCETSYRLGLQAGNKTWAGGAASDLAVVYRSMGEFSLSEKQAREAVRLLEDSRRDDKPRRDFLARAFLYLADVSIEQGRFPEGLAFSDRAIDVARKANLQVLETLLWDVRGFALLKAGKIGQASHALQQAEAIQLAGKRNPWLSVVLGHRSELELKKGNYVEALRLNDAAFASPTEEFSSVPAYYFVHVRGQILLALNRKLEALTQFRRAVDLASSWREAAMPGDNTNTQTVVYLNEVYHDFAQLAAIISLDRHDSDLSRQAWEALATNRAASLREQLTAALVNQRKVGDKYFSLLSELQASQARVTLGHNSSKDIATLEAIRLELSELEDQSLSLPTKKEKYRFQNSLKGIQARLHPREVLLSFCLGKSRSFLWAVTVNDVQLYELPKQAEIEQGSQRFAESLENGRDEQATGLSLTRTLFEKLSPEMWRKRDWIITEDGTAAGEIPYAALWDLSSKEHKRLIADHTLRTLPSELLLLMPDTSKPQRRFVGVADPIYNLADTRRKEDLRLVHTGNGQPLTVLGRLAGSEREIKAAATLSGMPETGILTGAEANGAKLRTALEKAPQLVHFAVHVVSPDGKPQEAALALSLTSANIPELLTREAVATYRVPGSLVILSGCASGQGKALPSAGLIGLGRAWLLAGASAVIVSAWPIPDDSGEFFSAFYGHFRKTVPGSIAQRAAAALRETQLDMQQSSGYRTSPSFWAAYSILSKE